MTAKRDLKRRVRERQTRTGESYTTALRHVLAAREPGDEPDSDPADTATEAVASDASDDETDSEPTDPGARPIDPNAASIESPVASIEPSGNPVGLDGLSQAARPGDGSPIDVDEARDITDAAAALGMKCRVLVFEPLARLAEPARILTVLRDTLVATSGDPATDLLRMLVFRGVAPPGPVVLTREPRFRKRVEAGLTGVSDDGRVLAIHVQGEGGIVTALCALWRNTPTLVLVTPTETMGRMVLPPGSIDQLAERFGVPTSAPASAPNLYLVFEGRRYSVTREPFVIGRHRTCDLQLKDGVISRKHAAVLWRHRAYYLVDLGSHAGVAYRGLRIENKRIEEGDLFRLGEYALRFTYLETDG